MTHPAPYLAIAAGGTGGHILPGIETGRTFLARNPDGRVRWFAGGRVIEDRVYTSRGVEPVRLRAGTWPGRGRALVSKWELLADTAGMLRRFRREPPDAVLAFGGAACVPVVLAAFVLRIPVILHESNAIPGRTTCAFARFATRVLLGMEGVPIPGAVVTGTPASPLTQEATPHAERDLVVCVGGSQGAGRLNELFLAALADPEIAAMPLRFHLVAGPGRDCPAPPAGLPEGKLAISEYEPDMGPLLARARVAVSRAGSGSLGDLAAHGVPAILIPYPHAADGHQEANAEHYVRHGAARMIAERDLTEEHFARILREMLRNADGLAAMAGAMHGLSPEGAAARVVEETLSALGLESRPTGAGHAIRTGGAA